MAEHSPALGRALDCATGNGQAAIGLAAHFDTVVATDISVQQVGHRSHHPRVSYFVCAAEHLALRNETVDAVVVAQALHWFSYEHFWPEVARVAKPGALFCAWGYDWLYSVPVVNDVLIEPVRDIIKPFWASNNQILWDGYRANDITFPFERIEMPTFAIELNWSRDELVEYLRTWTAFQHSLADPGAVIRLDRALANLDALIEPVERLPIRMPLKVIAGRIPRSHE